MAVTLLSSEEKTTSGSITIPANTTLVLAAIEGTDVAPQIDGVAMGGVSTIAQHGIISALGIFQYKPASIGAKEFTFSGTGATLVYAIGFGYRPGSVNGYAANGVYSANMATANGDLVLGILRGSIGPCTMKGDGTEMSYLRNTTLVKVGYVVAGAAVIACLASDSGVSEGYWADGGSIHHPAWTESAGYYEYDKHWVPGYWWTDTIPTPGHWAFNVATNSWTWIPAHLEYVQRWQDGYWTYQPVWHDAIYHPAWDEDIPDTWVPAGTSQISCAFCSIRETGAGAFIPQAIHWG